jgi:hypothetical protein
MCGNLNGFGGNQVGYDIHITVICID